MFDYGLLFIAAFFAGMLNAVAGGGSFLTFPALVFVGVPPIVANATSAVAVFPGYISATMGFMDELRAVPKRELMRLVVLSITGGVLGALLLMVTPSALFAGVVPWLLLLATALFAFDKSIRKVVARGSNDGGESSAHNETDGGVGRSVVTLIVTTYGGYFNGGLGIILLALFSALGMKDMNQMNGLKNGLSCILSFTSVVTFALAGLVVWPEAVLMMGAAILGGFAGARVARTLPQKAIRLLVVVIGLVMSVVFFWRLYG